MPKRKSAETLPTESARVRNARLLDAIGIDGIIERIENGQSVQAIADDIGTSRTALRAYIDRFADPAAITRARQESAESWAERGWQSLQLAEDAIDAARVNLAKHIESHCRWRAGIANPRYSERQQVELTGANGGPVQSLVMVYVPANGREEKVIDAEG